MGTRRGGGGVGDVRRRSRIPWKSEAPVSRGAPGFWCGEEEGGWAASGPGSLAGGGGGGKGGFEEKKARGTGRMGLLRGLMRRSAMAAADGRRWGIEEANLSARARQRPAD